MKLQQINEQFLELKKTGAVGEKLAQDTITVLSKIDLLLQDFENGSKSEVWMNNFMTFLGEENFSYALEIAKILGETKYKIEQLG